MERNNNLQPLDFILNRPNPIEPQSEPHKHPLNGTPHLPSGSSQYAREDLRRLLLERDVSSADGRPAKRRKSGASPGNDGEDVASSSGSLDLPKLPMRNAAKRMRIPPTLSGLHQPPPNAGLLPSISVEQPPQPVAPPWPTVAEIPTPPTAREVLAGDSNDPASTDSNGKAKRNKWTDVETVYLLKGVARFGIGNWSKVLECKDYSFDRRTPLDLRDRFRVCRPEDYKGTGETEAPVSNLEYLLDPVLRRTNEKDSHDASKGPKSERKSLSELRAIGIQEPFAKSKRRKRTKYSAIEDEALLDGFEKHGSAWALILEDDSDKFHPGRTATDLRDRFRTKFPDRYAKTGLAPRPEVFPPPPDRKKKLGETTAPEPARETTRAMPIIPRNPHQQASSLFPYAHDDVFFGAPFSDEEGQDNENIVLDRGILDWANDTRILPPQLPEGGGASIDPRTTLRPPNPLSSSALYMANNGGFAHPAASGGGASGEMLPPLAAITGGERNDARYRDDEQLELPSLMLGGHWDVGDGRGGINIEDTLG